VIWGAWPGGCGAVRAHQQKAARFSINSNVGQGASKQGVSGTRGAPEGCGKSRGSRDRRRQITAAAAAAAEALAGAQINTKSAGGSPFLRRASFNKNTPSPKVFRSKRKPDGIPFKHTCLGNARKRMFNEYTQACPACCRRQQGGGRQGGSNVGQLEREAQQYTCAHAGRGSRLVGHQSEPKSRSGAPAAAAGWRPPAS
jgi:hypothetical protein